MKVLAIMTSRPEALVLASMLEAAGIPVHIGAERHASVYPISVALGGHRLWVPADHYPAACDLVRDVDLPGSPVAYRGGQRAVLRFIGAYIGLHFAMAIPAVIVGALPLTSLLSIALLSLGVPTDPRGQPEWHLNHPPTG